jgi:hypothetical protein
VSGGPIAVLLVVEDFNSFDDVIANKHYWRNPVRVSMKSHIRAASPRFSQIVHYPLYCLMAPRSNILRGAWLISTLAGQSQST